MVAIAAETSAWIALHHAFSNNVPKTITAITYIFLRAEVGEMGAGETEQTGQCLRTDTLVVARFLASKADYVILKVSKVIFRVVRILLL